MLVCAACLLAMGCQFAERVSVNSGASFLEMDGTMMHPLNHADGAAVVLIFITADCPISNGYSPEYNRLAMRCDGGGVEVRAPRLYLVHVEPDITPEKAREHAKEFGYTCPVLLDPHHELVKAVGATVTPEAAVIDRNNRLVYLGRIDDQYVDLGKKRAEASHHELADAIDAVIFGKDVPVPRTSAVGCYIPESPQ